MDQSTPRWPGCAAAADPACRCSRRACRRTGSAWSPRCPPASPARWSTAWSTRWSCTTTPSPRSSPGTLLSYREAVDVALRKRIDLEVSTDVGRRRARRPHAGRPHADRPGLVRRHRAERRAGARRDVAPEAALRRGAGHRRRAGWYARRVAVAGPRRDGPARRRRRPAPGPAPPDGLRVGDPLDFWRVEALEPGRLLRLRAEMRLPGEAWLEWRSTPTDTGVTPRQRALFHPRGLYGRAYWLAVAPFHRLIFATHGRPVDAVAAAGRPPAHRWRRPCDPARRRRSSAGGITGGGGLAPRPGRGRRRCRARQFL